MPAFHIGANFMPVVYNRLFAALRGMPVNEKAITDGLEFLKQYFPIIEKQLTAAPIYCQPGDFFSGHHFVGTPRAGGKG